MHAITDKIPQKPVTIVEATSYTAVIAAAFAVSTNSQNRLTVFSELLHILHLLMLATAALADVCHCSWYVSQSCQS